MSFLARVQQRQSPENGLDKPSEIMRVVRLPVSGEPPLLDQRELQRRRSCPLKLNLMQQGALGTLQQEGALFGPIGVGHGKSWIAVLAGSVVGAHLSILLAPASTLDTLQRTHDMLREHFRTPRVHIMSYAQLSQPREECVLTELAKPYPPDKVIIVADEAHRLKRLESARTMRVVRFLQKNPAVTFIPLSGTMTSKSIKDFAHLVEMALRDNSPLPRNPHDLEAWSQVLDVAGRPNQADWARFHPLSHWGCVDQQLPCSYGPESSGYTKIERARAVFQHRLRTTPGVVASKLGSLGVSLIIKQIHGVAVPPSVESMMVRAEEGEDPAGEVLVDDVAVWRVKQHIAQGFYYVWDWPDGVVDEDWKTARSLWFRFVRNELKHYADQGYDSPLLVANRVSREASAGQDYAIHKAWKQWDGQRHKPPPPIKTVWIDDYLVRHAAHWAHDQKQPVILWYSSQAIGDLFREWGWPVYGAGENPPEHAHTCAMSIQAHGVGKNLQAWNKALVIAPPSGGQTWEQLLGRSHRQGQQADEVEINVYGHVQPFQESLDKAVKDANYIQQTSGNVQKLNYAVWA